ncbi:ribosomal-protein-alanine N-acetyltransferase [Sphingomonas koreensis]|nr:ribosomal-protein-alanine N-acetyltransferase [Sphingomonas koreensis]
MGTVLSVIALRSGGVGDLAAVDAVMRDAFDPRFGEAWTPGQCAGVMAMPGVWLTIAEADGVVAGFAMTRAILDEAELLLLAVRPVFRRRGIGKALLRSVIAACGERGVAKIHLEVRAGNEAIELYRLAGFTKIGERRDYYRPKSGKLFDAMTFQKSLL